MPDRPSLAATTRTVTGKKVRRLRREGITPGVVYGTVVETPVSVSLDTHDLERLYHNYGASTLVDINVDETDDYTVYIRNLQTNPVTRQPLHAEFYAPNLTIAMTANVPIVLVGESESTEGVVTQIRDFIELSGLPTDIPAAIEVDISGLLELDDFVAVGELEYGDNIELITDPEEALVRLIEVRVIEEDIEEEPTDEELEEGEMVEGEEGDEEAGSEEDAE